MPEITAKQQEARASLIQAMRNIAAPGHSTMTLDMAGAEVRDFLSKYGISPCPDVLLGTALLTSFVFAIRTKSEGDAKLAAVLQSVDAWMSGVLSAIFLPILDNQVSDTDLEGMYL